MSDFEEIEEELEEEELEEKEPEAIKRKIKVVEKELDNTSNLEWDYSKRLLKFGVASWVFGVCVFAATVLVFKGPSLILNAPPISQALLVFAGAVPVIITAILVQRYRRKIKRLKRLREDLLPAYEEILLKKVEENIA